MANCALVEKASQSLRLASRKNIPSVFPPRLCRDVENTARGRVFSFRESRTFVQEKTMERNPSVNKLCLLTEKKADRDATRQNRVMG
jgi:hypothetical protein